jgi:hypothetical protein
MLQVVVVRVVVLQFVVVSAVVPQVVVVRVVVLQVVVVLQFVVHVLLVLGCSHKVISISKPLSLPHYKALWDRPLWLWHLF